MEVIDMLDEREYLNKRKDYTGWNDRAEAADELVEDTAAEYARQERLEELAAWNAAAPEESKEEKEPKTMRQMNLQQKGFPCFTGKVKAPPKWNLWPNPETALSPLM